MRPVKFPSLALTGAMVSPLLFVVGFLFLFVSGIKHGILAALAIGTALILLGLVLLISGIVLVGVHRMLVSTQSDYGGPSSDGAGPSGR